VNPTPISSEINKSAVCGIIAMGAGFTQFSYLSAALDIPCMSSSTYFAVENQVLNNVKEVAINEMIDAGQEELRLALEAGEVDSNGVGMITLLTEHGVNSPNHIFGDYSNCASYFCKKNYYN
jgi:hypothetical protein